MEAEYIDKLSKANEFSDDLINILTGIIRDINSPAWDKYLQKLSQILINFTLQNKISFLRKSPSASIFINNLNKTLEEYCLDLVLQLLLKVMK